MLPIDPPESMMFSGGSKRNIGKKGVKLRVSIIISSIASADTYSESNQTSKMELFAKIVNVES